MGSYIFVRPVILPESVRAVTLPNDDGTFDIIFISIVRSLKSFSRRLWIMSWSIFGRITSIMTIPFG